MDFKRIALDTLIAGNVGAFVDLMYVACDDNEFGNRLPHDIPSLQGVARLLSEAETARRKGNTSAVISSYASLATKFAEQNNNKTSICFLQRSLEVAKLTGDTDGEMKSYHNLGCEYEKTNELEQALSFHQLHERLATTVGNDEEKRTASSCMYEVYKCQADQAVRDQLPDEELRLNLLAVAAAEASGNMAKLQDASLRAGRTLLLAGRPVEGIPHLQSHLQLVLESTPEGDLSGREARAYAALASAFQACGEVPSAVECLEEMLTGDASAGLVAVPELEVEAYESMGAMHLRQGLAHDALGFFEKAFGLRKNLLDRGKCSRASYDKLRLLVGVAKAAVSQPDWMDAVVENDTYCLTEWMEAGPSGGPPLPSPGDSEQPRTTTTQGGARAGSIGVGGGNSIVG